MLLDNDAILFGGWDETFTTRSRMSTVDGEGVRRGITVNSDVIAIIERYAFQTASGASSISEL